MLFLLLLLLGERLIHAAHNIGKDFNRYLCKDGVIAGFAYFEDSENVKYMLHPSDRETGISYRLLPLTRSIIANLAKPEQKDKNLCLIEEHLALKSFPILWAAWINLSPNEESNPFN